MKLKTFQLSSTEFRIEDYEGENKAHTKQFWNLLLKKVKEFSTMPFLSNNAKNKIKN